MANSDRELVITNLVSVLGGINGAAPYTTIVARVEQLDRSESEVNLGDESPWIGVIENDDEYSDLPGRTYYVVMNIDLKLVTAGDGWESARVNVNDLADDVFHAIHLDPSRGGNAHWTRVVRLSPVKRLAGAAHVASQTISIQVRFLRGITVNA